MPTTRPHGFHLDFGRINSWDPPSSLEFLWQISGDHAWERHGAGAQEYRDRFVEAWLMALARFTQHFDS